MTFRLSSPPEATVNEAIQTSCCGQAVRAPTGRSPRLAASERIVRSIASRHSPGKLAVVRARATTRAACTRARTHTHGEASCVLDSRPASAGSQRRVHTRII